MKHADSIAGSQPAAGLQPDGTPQRRPYQPPAIEETSQFETLALACGQNIGGGLSCSGGDPNDPYVVGESNYHFS